MEQEQRKKNQQPNIPTYGLILRAFHWPANAGIAARVPHQFWTMTVFDGLETSTDCDENCKF